MVLDGAEIDFLKNVVSDALNWPANSTGQTTPNPSLSLSLSL